MGGSSSTCGTKLRPCRVRKRGQARCGGGAGAVRRRGVGGSGGGAEGGELAGEVGAGGGVEAGVAGGGEVEPLAGEERLEDRGASEAERVVGDRRVLAAHAGGVGVVHPGRCG